MTELSSPQIFVSIASYRDTECQWTIKDLFEKASDPDRIVIGLCSQVVPEEDDDCFLISTRPKQCREVRVHVAESNGACWARQKIQTQWQGEQYTLQIDSHMRFVRDWDQKLLTMLAQCPSSKAVISTYAIAYEPPDKLHAHQLIILRPKYFDERGLLRTNPTGKSIAAAPAIPEQNPFCSGHFLFGRSQIIAEVPSDPYIYLANEEVTLAPRLWTSGWDIYVPNEVVMFHDYTDRERRKHKHWNDNRQWGRLADLSAQRARYLLAGEPCRDAEALREIDHYGLGTRRSLEEYQAFSGVDFRHRLINGQTADEIEMAMPPEQRRARTAEVFRKHWRRSVSGPMVARSGQESTVASTAAIRVHMLRRLFSFLDIKALADAGCGDLNWMSFISPLLHSYLGFDVADELVADLRQCYGGRRGHSFATADITIDTLPACDAILCRDVLTQLPLPYVKAALSLFKASGSRYLIATTHKRETNRPIALGGSQPLNLTAAPFGLPPPILAIPDPKGSSKVLGVWRMTELPNFTAT